ncbi:MAG TPA: filamentous hemagglutinin N-terminal domain-containing protein [Candidatus Obscuribacterales bacterium]
MRKGTFARGLITLTLVTEGAIASSSNYAVAQIIPDASLGSTNSIVTPDTIKGLPSDRIEGGAIRGTNLFHSFQEFNINAGRGGYFTNPVGIDKIFTRVTGSNPSNILGTLGVLGNANLFLMNPNGIIFGTNASLDVNASFLATTANSINFADGTNFSTRNPESAPALTVSVPIGLGMGSNPGTIRVQGSAQVIAPSSPITISYEQSLLASPDGIGVLPGKTLALLGGDVILEAALLKAETGRIEIGAVGDGVVSLIPESDNLILGYQGIQNFQNIQMSQQTYAVTTGDGGGDIQVAGRRITLSDRSRITASTTGTLPGGNVTIQASELIEIRGANVEFAGGIFAPTAGSGNAGNIKIKTRQLRMQEGTRVTAFSNGSGNGGTVNIHASELVELSGASPNGDTVTSLESRAYADGDGGDVQIQTQQLSLHNGAQISASTFSSGNGGKVNVNASESLQVVGRTPNRRFPSAVVAVTSGSGRSGEISIKTGKLVILDGARISAATSNIGDGGSLKIRASLVQVIGTGADERNIPIPSGLFARSLNNGNAGDMEIVTQEFIVRDGAEVTVAGLGKGHAGNLHLRTNSLQLDNSGMITAATQSGEGGNINLQAQDVQLTRQSAIVATADGTSNGGNIKIDSTRFLLLGNSDILATADQGSGGNINLKTAVFIADFFTPNAFKSGASGTVPELRSNNRADISASSQFGQSGVMTIPEFNNNINNSLKEESTRLVTSEQIVSNSCLARRNLQEGSFTVIGTGGLPSNPYISLNDRYSLAPVQAISNDSKTGEDLKLVENGIAWKPGDAIVEAQSLVKTADGRILLVKTPPSINTASDLICSYPQ